MIVVPGQGNGGKSIVNDKEPQDRPIAYTKTPEFQSLGMYGSSEDITVFYGYTEATNPVYRWQNHGEFNMLFNALLNYDDLGPKAERKPVTQDASQR